MFFLGSRYRNVPQSSPVDADGQRLLGTNLRVIPPSGGTFLHTVQDHDRLDLLALKYYGDASKWWQISDANPESPYPSDLLDRGPLTEEVLTLVSPGAEAAFQGLKAALGAFGTVRLAEGDLLTRTVVVSYAPSSRRALILQEVAARGFGLLASTGWNEGAAFSESFTLEDPSLRLRWRELLDDLGALPGVAWVRSEVAGGAIRLAYNTAATARGDVREAVARRGFAVVPEQSFTVERVGAKFTVPPNGGP